jgi:hypothetical protein
VRIRSALPAILMLFSSGVPASAADWMSLGKLDNGNRETFVDLSSIRIDGSIRRGAYKVVFASHVQAGGGEYASKWVSYFSYRFAFNCDDKIGRVEAMAGYFDDGTSYVDHYFPKPWQVVPVAPKTNWTTLMEYVSAWKP